MSRKERIEDILRHSVEPMHLEVTDESHMHSVPPGAESHFKVLVVSQTFADQTLVARHRLLNRALAAELTGGLHALSLHAWTPEEWFARGGVSAPDSPPCQGGSKAA
ncbi:MAG: BolA/IbaG family iron-sulfur metabolism protein [Thiocapsa sp.]|nr:BolA/IbaG family iron-sulfur metabolism protein [Thiocapsa sp.]MCG6896757.1 BolA/IbaG family iron-sulfur metabolism protein [Thiocapsa sp.]MCG6986224.1 BolA/IbaG family iron-sulfur metabolism protein [Thiocapsa sp.]